MLNAIDEDDLYGIACEGEADNLGAYPPTIMENLSTLARNIVRLIEKFIQLVIKMTQKIKGFFRKMSVKLQDKFGSNLIVDQYGYIDTLAETSPIINDYFASLQNLRSIDVAILSHQDIMTKIQDKIQGSTVGDKESYNKTRGYYEKWMKNVQNIEIYDEKLRDILQEMKGRVSPYAVKKYTPKHIDNFMKRHLYAKIDGLTNLKKDLEITKKFYNNKGWLSKHTVNKENVKRNSECLKHTNNLLNIMNKFVVMCSKIVQVDNDDD